MNHDDEFDNDGFAHRIQEATVDLYATPDQRRIDALRRAVAQANRATTFAKPSRFAWLAKAAVVAVLCGCAAFAGRMTVDQGPADPPTEAVQLAGVDSGVTAEAELINHTWGVELVLDIEGTSSGSSYDVTYQTAGGPVSAGSFVSVDALMHCRFNAAVLRSELSEIHIVERTSGETITARLA